jgi:hypothetical protein
MAIFVKFISSNEVKAEGIATVDADMPAPPERERWGELGSGVEFGLGLGLVRV